MRPRPPIAAHLALSHVLLALLLVAQLALAATSSGAQPARGQIEPTAGSWKTWLLSSGSELRLPAPPNRGATQAELRQLQKLAAQRPASQEQIAYWTSGGSAYRWNELALEMALKNGLGTVAAGYELGRAVAARVVAHAKSDGSSAVWNGSVPTGPGFWSGTNPVLPMAGTWKTWVLTSGSELRPGPPPAYDSAQMKAEMDEVRAFQRTPQTNNTAYFWEYGAGGSRGYWYWNELLQRKVLEYGLADNPPRAARAFALPDIALYDAFVACWDAKYTYWSMRPFQLDPSFKPLVTTPNHPAYPSAHSCLSQAMGATMAYLFPRDAGHIYALVEEAGESRIAAGIHRQCDQLAPPKGAGEADDAARRREAPSPTGRGRACRAGCRAGRRSPVAVGQAAEAPCHSAPCPWPAGCRALFARPRGPWSAVGGGPACGGS